MAGNAAGAVAGEVRGFAAHGGVAGEEAAMLRVEAVREVVGGAPPHHVLGSRDGLRRAMPGVPHSQVSTLMHGQHVTSAAGRTEFQEFSCMTGREHSECIKGVKRKARRQTSPVTLSGVLPALKCFA